jgi:hypothetical protein
VHRASKGDALRQAIRAKSLQVDERAPERMVAQTYTKISNDTTAMSIQFPSESLYSNRMPSNDTEVTRFNGRRIELPRPTELAARSSRVLGPPVGPCTSALQASFENGIWPPRTATFVDLLREVMNAEEQRSHQAWIERLQGKSHYPAMARNLAVLTDHMVRDRCFLKQCITIVKQSQETFEDAALFGYNRMHAAQQVRRLETDESLSPPNWNELLDRVFNRYAVGLQALKLTRNLPKTACKSLNPAEVALYMECQLRSHLKLPPGTPSMNAAERVSAWVGTAQLNQALTGVKSHEGGGVRTFLTTQECGFEVQRKYLLYQHAQLLDDAVEREDKWLARRTKALGEQNAASQQAGVESKERWPGAVFAVVEKEVPPSHNAVMNHMRSQWHGARASFRSAEVFQSTDLPMSAFATASHSPAVDIFSENEQTDKNNDDLFVPCDDRTSSTQTCEGLPH